MLSLSRVALQLEQGRSLQECVGLELEKDWSPAFTRSFRVPLPVRASGEELVERLFGEPVASMRAKVENPIKKEPSCDLESSVAQVLAKCSSSNVSEPSEPELRFAELLRAHRSGEPRFELTPVGNPNTEQLPGVGGDSSALSTVRMLGSDGKVSSDPGMLLRHDISSLLTARLLATMTKATSAGGHRMLVHGNPDLGKKTLVSQLTEPLSIALDHALIRAEPLASAPGEEVKDLEEKLGVTVCSPVPLKENSELREFLQKGLVTEIFADPYSRERAIGWTARLTGLPALVSLERDPKSLTLVIPGALNLSAVRMVVEAVVERKAPALCVAHDAFFFFGFSTSPELEVQHWAPAQLRLLRSSQGAAPWLAAFSDQALEDALHLFGGSLGSLRKALELLRDPREQTWFLGPVYEELARIARTRPTKWLDPPSLRFDPSCGSLAQLTQALGNFVLGHARPARRIEHDMPGLDDYSYSAETRLYTTGFRFAHRVEAEPWSSGRFLPADLGLEANLAKRLASDEIKHVRPELREVCALARRGVLTLQRSVVFAAKSPGSGICSKAELAKLGLGTQLEDGAKGLSTVLAESARALEQMTEEARKLPNLSFEGLNNVPGVSALLFVPDAQVREGMLPELFPPALLKRALGLEEDASPQKVLKRFCGVVFLEVVRSPGKEGDHLREYQRLIRSPEWKAKFGKKLPLRLCLATEAAGPGAFGLESLPEAERELELHRIFAGAELVTVSEEAEFRWERECLQAEERRRNHEAWLAGVAREKGLASVRALLQQK